MTDYIPQVNASSLFNTSSAINPYEIATGNHKVDAKLFQLYLTTTMTKIDNILSSNDNEEDDSSSDIFGTSSDSLFANATTTANSQYSSGTTLYQEMIAKANLIGKTVEAIDPDNNKIFTGKVYGVTVESGKVEIIIGDKKVPPENLISVKE